MENYESPYASRYGSPEMRRTWSEEHKRRLWREFWYKLLKQQHEDGLLSLTLDQEHLQLAESVLLLSEYTQSSMDTAQEHESRVQHDLVGELLAVKEELRRIGFDYPNVLHAGATSSDCEDYADAVRISDSLQLLSAPLLAMATLLAKMGLRLDTLPIEGYTHLQPAEPTMLGYRFAVYARMFWTTAHSLLHLENDTWSHAGKLNVGGATGTSSNLVQLAFNQDKEWSEIRSHYTSGQLRLQTVPRIDELRLAQAISALASVCYKIAADLRLMQAQGYIREGRKEGAVGSSAMPGKTNPILCENACSVARHLRALSDEAWDYSAHSYLERTLDDSAQRRTVLPELFIGCEQMLASLYQAVEGLAVNREHCEQSLEHNEGQWVASRYLALLKAAGWEVTNYTVEKQVMRADGRAEHPDLYQRLLKFTPHPGAMLDEAYQRTVQECNRLLLEIADVKLEWRK